MKIMFYGMAIVLAIAISLIQGADAATIFESAELGETGISTLEVSIGEVARGANVSDNVFNGVRFQIQQPVLTTQIGGHFVGSNDGDGSFFGAVVQLTHKEDFPDSDDLSTPDVLGTTLLSFPEPSNETFGDLQLELEPGWYAIVFGSGLFQAMGQGAALLNNQDVDQPSYIGRQSVGSWFERENRGGTLEFNNYYFALRGEIVPEPSSTSIAFALLLVAQSKITRLLMTHKRS